MQKRKKAKLFSLRYFPMDFARVQLLALPLFCPVRRLTQEGKKYRNKIKGGALVAANHYGFSDPLVLFITFWYRRVFFLAANVVMRPPIRRALLKGIGAIEINREIADMQAIRTTVDKLKQGHLVGVFPQGRLTKTAEVTAIKSGVVLMALQADVPIYPMHIYPAGKWYQGRTVVIGEPVYPSRLCQKKFPSTADIQKISDILMEEMNKCNINLKEEAK